MRAGHETLTYRGKTVVRTIGALLLGGCCLMVVLGVTVWADRLHGPQFVLYWSWCFLLATAAIGVALVDMILIRRAGRQRRRQLFQEQFRPR